MGNHQAPASTDRGGRINARNREEGDDRTLRHYNSHDQMHSVNKPHIRKIHDGGTVATCRIRYNPNQNEWEEVSICDHHEDCNECTPGETEEAMRQKARTRTGASFQDTKARLKGWQSRKRLSRRVSQKFEEGVKSSTASEEKKNFLSQGNITQELESSANSNQPDRNIQQALSDSQLEEIPAEDETYQTMFLALIRSCTKRFGKYSGNDEDKQDVWKIGAHIYQFPTTKEIYQGQWLNGKRHGRGDQIWVDGSAYQGSWDNDMRHGKGRFISFDGNLYEGRWKNNMLHGTGKCIYANGSSYEGGWYEDKKHGYGTEVFPDGSKYEGRYVMNKRHGKGKQTWPDGSFYKGEFAEDSMEGYGAMTWSDGRKYVGTWKQNKMDGRGEFSWKDGKLYIGEYSDNMKHGQGEFRWPNKSGYKGPFVDNKMHGEGIYYTKDQKNKKGQWEEGKLVKWL